MSANERSGSYRFQALVVDDSGEGGGISFSVK
jgi:hypothetical protein